jgi:hypothetical protein
MNLFDLSSIVIGVFFCNYLPIGNAEKIKLYLWTHIMKKMNFFDSSSIGIGVFFVNIYYQSQQSQWWQNNELPRIYEYLTNKKKPPKKKKSSNTCRSIPKWPPLTGRYYPLLCINVYTYIFIYIYIYIYIYTHTHTYII